MDYCLGFFLLFVVICLLVFGRLLLRYKWKHMEIRRLRGLLRQMEDSLNRVQKDLQFERKSLRELENLVQIGRCEWNIENNKVKLSDSLLDILGQYQDKDITIEECFSNHIDQKYMLFIKESLSKIIHDKNMGTFEIPVHVENNDLAYLRFSFQPELSEGGDVINVRGVVFDVTEFRRRESDLVHQLEKALKGEQVKNDFITNMSHDFRTPLHGILSFAQFGLDDLQEENCSLDDLRRYFKDIIESAESLFNALRSMMDMILMEEGVMVYQKKEMKMEKLIFGMMHLFQREAEVNQKEMQFIKYCNFSSFAGDEKRIEQVLENMVSNAIKMAYKNSTIRLELNELYCSGKPYVLVMVESIGMTIDKSEINLILEPFSYSKRGSIVGEVPGLGLAVSKMIINDHGGEMWLESNNGKTRVFLTLPSILNS